MASNFRPGGVQWDSALPSAVGEFIPIVSVKPHQTLTVIITGYLWQGVWTHYFLDRSRPCLGDELACEGCHQRLSKRFKAYLCGALFGTGRSCIIELTAGAVRSCPALVSCNGQLRGRKAQLRRMGNAKNSPVKIDLGDALPDHAVPQSFNLMRALCKVWGVEYAELDGDEGTTYLLPTE